MEKWTYRIRKAAKNTVPKQDTRLRNTSLRSAF